jgi:hypothetical protein
MSTIGNTIIPQAEHEMQELLTVLNRGDFDNDLIKARARRVLQATLILYAVTGGVDNAHSYTAVCKLLGLSTDVDLPPFGWDKVETSNEDWLDERNLANLRRPD